MLKMVRVQKSHPLKTVKYYRMFSIDGTGSSWLSKRKHELTLQIPESTFDNNEKLLTST
jgi:hypothetical protein